MQVGDTLKSKEERKAGLAEFLANSLATEGKTKVVFTPQELFGAEIRIGNKVIGHLPNQPIKVVTSDKSKKTWYMLANDFNATNNIGTCEGADVMFGLKLAISK